MDESMLTSIKGHLAEIFLSSCTACSVKFPIAIAMAIVAYLFGLDAVRSLTALVGMLVFDLATGIGASYISGHPITSRKALKTATKLSVYAIMVSSSHLTDTVVPGVNFLETTVISFLVLTEFVSIMENIGNMGYTTPKKILNQVKHMVPDAQQRVTQTR